MENLYLTPASISYLTQFILGLVITVYLILRWLSIRESQREQTAHLICLFIISTLFVGMLFWDTAVLPAPRLYIVYLENTVLGIMLVLLLQFAYRFPLFSPQLKLESLIVLGLSILYTLYEVLYALYRFYLILRQDMVVYRFPEADYALAAVFVWVPVVFLRQTIFADERPVHWLHKLWNPQGLGARGSRTFAFIFILLLTLSIISVLEGLSLISTSFYNASLSLGILVAIWLFATAYLNFLPEKTSFLVKLSGVTLTLLLAVLGQVGWASSPAYAVAFQPALTDHQTLHFSPSPRGGYDITPIPFAFETEMGERFLSNTSHSRPVSFTFPFYEKIYTEIYITGMGVLSMGENLHHPNLQFDYAASPVIFPLLVNLDLKSGGGVFTRVTSDRLIVTWDHLSAPDDSASTYTFQTILYRDGSFDITYNGLPDPLVFRPDALPSSVPWLRGVTPGLAASVEQVGDLSQSAQSNPQGIIQDFYLDFREHLHEFVLPLVWLVIASSLLIIFGLPVLINTNLVKPLNALLSGVGQMETGDLSVEMPIQYRDEIGSLTSSFNMLAVQLRLYVTDLEQRVEERTQKLRITNTQLQNEIHEREQAEEALQESKKIAEDLFEFTPDALLTVDSAGSITRVNKHTQVMFGYAREELLHQSIDILIPKRFHSRHTQDVTGFFVEPHVRPMGERLELLAIKRDGREFPVDILLSPLQLGDKIFVTAVVRDITERKLAEEALLQTQIQVIEQQRTVATFEERERVARELHDGIGQILGFVNVQAQAAQTLLENEQLKAAQKNLEGLVQVVQEAHANLRHTILGLRDSTVPQHNFYQDIQAYLDSFKQTWGVKTIFSLPQQGTLPVLPAVVEDQLLHIVQETLVNIRKHAKAQRVEVLIAFRAGEMTLIISDDGLGFDPLLVPGAKEEHFGLNIMRERAEQVGGRMEIRSAIGHGTQLFFHIPLASTFTSTSQENPKDMYSLRILLVDDQPLFLGGMQNLLKARGLTVIGIAHDGLEAFEQVKALHPDVVLMDVQMPNCDGIEATRLIKNEFPETKVVLLTVSEDDEHLFDAIKYGASSYLLKNLDADQLFATLDGVARGEIQIAPELASRLLAEYNRAGSTSRSAANEAETIPAELNARQWEVLRLIARGLTYKEAGRELNVTEQGIKYHMAQILDRLQVKNREQAIAYLRQVQESRRKKDSKPRG